MPNLICPAYNYIIFSRALSSKNWRNSRGIDCFIACNYLLNYYANVEKYLRGEKYTRTKSYVDFINQHVVDDNVRNKNIVYYYLNTDRPLISC